MLEHEVLPLLEQRGRAVPVEGELHDDDVVRDEERLLARHVDVEGGIRFVEVVQRQLGARGHVREHAPVHARFLERGVCEEDEDAWHAGKLPRCTRAGQSVASATAARGRPTAGGLLADERGQPADETRIAPRICTLF